MSTTREVIVLADFTDSTGVQRTRKETFVVAYATERQRQKVNELVYRGFLSFDVENAKTFLGTFDVVPAPAEVGVQPVPVVTKKRAPRSRKPRSTP